MTPMNHLVIVKASAWAAAVAAALLATLLTSWLAPSPGRAQTPAAAELRNPTLIVDGEMQADTAMDENILRSSYSFSVLKDRANVLIFPNLSAGNIAYKLLHHLGGATKIGPFLVGMNLPVHVLEQGADVQDIVNMAAVAVMDAQQRVSERKSTDGN